jgi:hypothetical protein
MSESCICSPTAGADTCELRVAPSDGKAACPTNHKVGKRVHTLTVKAMLALPLTEIRSAGYWFCPDAACPTVYYSDDGAQIFSEADLRERVYQKHPNDENVFICYCFRHTPKSIRTELTVTGKSSVVGKITTGIQAEQCACDIRNPQGSCCLGNIRKMTKA